jgi:murein DD-endopeptidase MepM/ murein hydrolase activator NlpD
MTHTRRRTARRELLAAWVITGAMLTAAWLIFRVQDQPSLAHWPRGQTPTRAPVASKGDRTSTAPLIGHADIPVPQTTIADADIVELRRRHLPIPVVGVSASSLVQTFHQARSSGEHEALDILAPRGTPAIAVEDGRVAKLFTSQRGGLTAYLFDPSETYCYYYAHLDRYDDDVREGEHIMRGHVVGFVGTTGNAPPETPHLHFAVFKLGPEKRWWEGTPLDPYLIWR